MTGEGGGANAEGAGGIRKTYKGECLAADANKERRSSQKGDRVGPGIKRRTAQGKGSSS